MQLITIVAMIFAVSGVLFALQNSQTVPVNFLSWEFSSSLAMVLLLAVVLGALILGLMSTPATLRRQWANSRQAKRIAELEEECDTQKATIAELRKKVSAPVPVEDPEKTRPYMGLKQLMTGGDKAEPPKP